MKITDAKDMPVATSAGAEVTNWDKELTRERILMELQVAQAAYMASSKATQDALLAPYEELSAYMVGK